MLSFRRLGLALSPAALLLSGTAALAQDPARMIQIVEIEEEAGKYMGAALVAKDGKILLDKGFGEADLEWDIANTTDTKFRIGSVTKQFTAASILLLQERGKLSVDDPIGKHWPAAPEAWEAITLRHLLNHTSGIPNVTSFDDFGTVKYLPTTRDALIGRFSSKDLEFAPGEQWKYSNSGYLMLSAVVEEVSGQTYASFVQDNILTPLGMSNTGIDSSAAILPKRASGYSPSDAGIVNADYVNMAIPQGAGAMYSTTHDLLTWQQGLFGGKLLQPASLEAYTTPIDLVARGTAKYAFGVLVEETDDGTAIWHGGGIEGFNAWLGHDPAQNITVVVLANLNGGTASSLGTNLMKLARGGELTLPSEREAVAVSADALEEYVGTYAVAPTFKIVVTQEEGSLKAQATGQAKFDLFNEAKDLFFLKVVDAKLRFERDDEGTITGATLLQGGRETPAARE